MRGNPEGKWSHDMYSGRFCFILDKISVADPDPGSGAFLTPGSGMGRKSASGSGIRDEQPGSYLLELRKLETIFFVFLGLKYLNSLLRIRDPGWKKSDPG